jgi:hypothetical protein
MDNGPRIASCLLTVLLLGVTAVGMSFAEEVSPGTHAAGNSSNSPEETGGPPPSSLGQAGVGKAKLDGLPEAHGKGGDKRDDARTLGGSERAQQGIGGTISGPGTSNPGDNGDHTIDSRIGMPSRRLDHSRSGVGNVKDRVRQLAPRRPSTPGKSDRGLRNAIGLPVAPHSGQERREGEHRGVPIVVPNVPAASAAESTNAEAHQERPTSVRADTGAGLSSSTSNRGTISGTGAMHAGAGQPGIGGRAKTVAGINGSIVRSKH